MAENIKLCSINQDIKPKESQSKTEEKFSVPQTIKAYNFASSFPEFKPTPLVHLENLSQYLKVKSLYIKDESYRFNLNSFKGLGASFAIGNYIAQLLKKDISEVDYTKMTSDETRKILGDKTFITATDGNHGRAVAWTANRLKQHSVVYMCKGSSIEKLNNIKKLGSEGYIIDKNYDDTIRYAQEQSEKNGWIIVQDTTLPGYTDEIPTWIMEGYSVICYEAFQQLKILKDNMKDAVIPTHIFLQAGVGAMAGGVTGFIQSYFNHIGVKRPKVLIVEPNKADCVFRTAQANDGKLHFVTGDMDSIMAGLSCGEPCQIGWDMMKDHADYFFSVPDWVTAKGMRVLGNPMKGDNSIISGESGAVTAGLVFELMTNTKLEKLRNEIGLNNSSIILCFSTEGDTDRNSYRDIVWNGNFESMNK